MGETLFCFQQSFLVEDFRAICDTKISSYTSVRSHHTMTWHIGCKRVLFESLTNGLCATASATSCKFAIADGLTGRYIEQGEIHSSLKLCDIRSVQHTLFYFLCCASHLFLINGYSSQSNSISSCTHSP